MGLLYSFRVSKSRHCCGVSTRTTASSATGYTCLFPREIRAWISENTNECRKTFRSIFEFINPSKQLFFLCIMSFFPFHLIGICYENLLQLLLYPQLHLISTFKVGFNPLQYSIVYSYIICTHNIKCFDSTLQRNFYI